MVYPVFSGWVNGRFGMALRISQKLPVLPMVTLDWKVLVEPDIAIR